MSRLLIVNKPPKSAPDARVLLWNPSEATAEQGFPAARDAGDEDAADEAAMAWTKAFGRRPLVDGRSLREILVYKGVPLWWPTEIYLYHQTRATDYVRLIETFARILGRERPLEVAAPDLDPVERLLLSRVATQMGVLSEATASPGRFALRTLRRSLESRWNSAKTLASSAKSLWARQPAGPEEGDPVVAVLSHAAFWSRRDDGKLYEHYFDRLLPRLQDTKGLTAFVLGVGPRAPFRNRSLLARLRDWVRLQQDGPYVPIYRYTRPQLAWDALGATAWIRKEWKAIRGLPALREGFTHRGVPFSDLTEPDLAATLLLEVPWAYRSFREIEAALESSRARALLLYAESSGWGRVALEAARSREIPSVAIQHGILYPKYFSYRHDPDEASCPRPTATALFGEAARDFLVREGRYSPESLVTTGSPKFDALLDAARNWDRAALRQRLGASAEHTLIVVASRFRGILPTHRAIGSALPGFLRAVAARPDLRIVVKPHPAEGLGGYLGAIRDAGAGSVQVLPPAALLTELLWASDLLVTVESLSAVEALVLGRGVVVLNMPTNLKELVEAGVALGVDAGADPGPVLDRIVHDPATQASLKDARARYLDRVAMGVDGQATERILGLVCETARPPRP